MFVGLFGAYFVGGALPMQPMLKTRIIKSKSANCDFLRLCETIRNIHINILFRKPRRTSEHERASAIGHRNIDYQLPKVKYCLIILHITLLHLLILISAQMSIFIEIWLEKSML